MKRILSIFLAFLLILNVFLTGGSVYAETGGDGSDGGGMGVSTVIGITIESQPKLSYVSGEKLDLMPIYDDNLEKIHEGLLVTLQFSDRDSLGPMDFSDFEMFGTAFPDNDTVLTQDHDGQTIKLTCNGLDVYTNPLSVTTDPVEGATLSPSKADFDKYPSNQADVITEIQWGHSLLLITDVRNGENSIGIGNYNVYTEEEKDYLSISKTYLATQPAGELSLEVVFSDGDSAWLTITILQDSTVPIWPEGSSVTTLDTTLTTITLSWSEALDAVTVSSYKIDVVQNNILIRTEQCNETSFVFTGLEPGTEYEFRIQAKNMDNVLSEVLPYVASTLSGKILSSLRVIAPRQTMDGFLYMEDTIDVELVSPESGLAPKVTVLYKEWDALRTATVEKTKELNLMEMTPGSGMYKASFFLIEGISEIISLEGTIADTTETYHVNLKVAGRLKGVVLPPADLTPEQQLDYYALLDGSFIWISQGNRSYMSDPIQQGVVMIDHSLEGDSYKLEHYSSLSYFIYSATTDIAIQNGLETVFEYTIDSFSHLKVKVVDDVTGEAIANVLVESRIMVDIQGMPLKKSTKSIHNGTAATTGLYFAKNLMKGSSVELVASYAANSNDIKNYYDDQIVRVDSLDFHENIITIRMKRVAMVTLEGLITDSNSKPIENAQIQVRQVLSGNKTLYATAFSNASGQYSMEVAKTSDMVTFSRGGYSIRENVLFTEDRHVLNAVIQVDNIPVVYVYREAMNYNGNIIDATSLLDVVVLNKTSGEKYMVFKGNSRCYLQGSPGDIIEVSAGGGETGYSPVKTTTTLDEQSSSSVKLTVPITGNITARFLNESGDGMQGVERFLLIYDATTEEFVKTSHSDNQLISCPLADGEYYAVLTWSIENKRTLSEWLNTENTLITEKFTVKTGESTFLGQFLIGFYNVEIKANNLSCNQVVALPGSIITLRAAYDFKPTGYLDPNRMTLEVPIPWGTVPVDLSQINHMTRGNIGDAQPIIGTHSVTLDLTKGLELQEGFSGAMIFQLKVDDTFITEDIKAVAKIHEEYPGNVIPRTTIIGNILIPQRFITLHALNQIKLPNINMPILLNGFAPAGKTVELFDGDIRIGETEASPDGSWATFVTLPHRGTPIYHTLYARVVVNGMDQIASSLILVGINRVFMSKMEVRSDIATHIFFPEQGIAIFPLSVASSAVRAFVEFDPADKVENVKLSGRDTTKNGNVYSAIVPDKEITVEYDEKKNENESILMYDFDEAPDFIKDAATQFVNEENNIPEINYDSDGYIHSFHLPEIKLSALDGSISTNMSVELVDFNPDEAHNKTHLGNGLYGYNFSYEKIDDKYIISAYLDRELLEDPNKNQRSSARALSVNLKKAQTVIEMAGKGDKLLGAFGDLSKGQKLIELGSLYHNVRPELAPHMQEYYDNQLEFLAGDIAMGKTLGLVTEGIGKSEKLVPILGKVIIGAAEFISGTLIGNMFDNEFDSDYTRLMTNLRNESQLRNISDHFAVDYGNYQYNYSIVAYPKLIRDPSGFVYEAIEENPIDQVTATLLFLPKDSAPDAIAAKASNQWEFWDAEWFNQINPQITRSDGKYAWDVPEGWWMVQFMKDGYQDTYSDALPVPPPQVNINIPMTRLDRPSVEKTIWGNGGRYVDIQFSKYMDVHSLNTSHAIGLTDSNNKPVDGTITSPVPEKTGVNNLNLSRMVRFIPTTESLVEGAQYQLKVNKGVSDYAGFTMLSDYTETAMIPTGPTLSEIHASSIEVEPNQDITALVSSNIQYIPNSSTIPGLLDTRVSMVTSDKDVVHITLDQKIQSLSEGNANITLTSLDDPSITAVLPVTVASPVDPVRVAHMVVLDQNQNVLTDLNLPKGEIYNLSPIITPMDATNKAITYTSDDPSVVSIDTNGRINAISEGLATVTVKTIDQNIRQIIHIKVGAPLPVSDSSPGTGSSTSYYAGLQVTDPSGLVKNTTLPVTVDRNTKKATLNLMSESNLASSGNSLVLHVPSFEDVDTYTVKIQAAHYSIPEKQGEFTINTDIGSFTIPSNMLTGITGAHDSQVEISIGLGDKSNLPKDIREAIGDRPLVQLTLTIDGRKINWNNPEAPVRVSIPYTPTETERANHESIVIWYIDGSGHVINIPNGHYDSGTGTVTFSTTHFSHYAVAFNPVNFKDVSEDAWYAPSVSFIAAREITTGTGHGNYSPEGQLTRGDFIVLMMRAYGIAPDSSPSDNFSDAGNTYYTGYLSTAKRLNITAGVGNNMYAPNKEITRQELFTLLYNALKVVGQLPQGDTGKTLSSFSDAEQISSWAEEAMKLLVKTGTIQGHGDKLNPTNTTTRAEMAQVLSNLLWK